MIGFRHFPKLDLSTGGTEDIRKFGVRFVFFSEESESKAKVFGDKLGVETAFNCVIRLQKSNDPTDVFLNSNSKSKSGGKYVRYHGGVVK